MFYKQNPFLNKHDTNASITENKGKRGIADKRSKRKPNLKTL